jgi:single-stranded-DNA-specific exonuclease
LARRGVTTVYDAKIFLDGGLETLHSPFLLPDMEKAVLRLKQAIEGKEKILIYGDYDVDGITSVALIVRTLRRVVAGNLLYFIPKRLEEGYGLHRSALEKAVQNSCTLVVTVDCGITGNEEADFLRSVGVDLIVTDHHEPPAVLPAAYAIINPKLPSIDYPWPNLAGVGVAYKLLQALATRMPELTGPLEENLELVAIGTVADIVPLLNENRILVKEGLRRIAASKNKGLLALLRQIRLEPPISANQIGFALAPRINASGRLSSPGQALRLFLTNDSASAVQLAEELEAVNKERQAIEEKVLTDALKQLETEFNAERDRVIVLAGEGWHPGVIGIVASKIMERYYRPTVLVGLENGVGRGSARSIPGFHLFAALEACSSYLEKFGGHEMAAGLTIRSERIEDFRKEINRIATEKLTADQLQPVLAAEAEIPFSLVTLDLVKEIAKLAPFGAGNPTPVLVARDLCVLSSRTVGENAKHLKVKLGLGSLSRDGIGFNLGSFLATVANSKKVDVAFSVEENTWNMVTDVQMVIKDIETGAQFKEETA